MALTQIQEGMIAGVSGSIITGSQSIPSTTLPIGSVLQVVNATFNTYVSTTSTSFIDTGLTASITPKFSTSKILVLASINGINGSAIPFTFIISNGSNTQLLSIVNNNFAGFAGYSVSAQLLHSPATISAYTYKIQFKANTAGTVFFNNYINTIGNTSSQITLMEIAG